MAKPKPPELPKDAYGDDFPTLSVRETANRWGGGLAKRAGGVPPKEGGPGSLQSLPTGSPRKSAVPAKTGPMAEAPKVATVPVPKAAGADAASTGGTGGCDPIDSGITHPRPEVPPPRAIKSAPAGPSTQAKPCKVELQPGKGSDAPGATGENNPQPEDSTPSLLTDASMGVESHPRARTHSLRLRMRAGPKVHHPAKALGEATMAEAVAGLGTMLLHPRPMNRRVTMAVAVGPVIPAAAVIHPIPMIQNSAQNPNTLHPP